MTDKGDAASSGPFVPTAAMDAVSAGSQGDFLLPICLPSPGILLGEEIAVILLTTIEGQRVGVPLGMQDLSDLRETITEALRMMQAPEGGSVQ